jgi:hypothetical protein
MSSLTLEFEKVLFHSEHQIELMDQEDRVIEDNIRRVMNHCPILQGSMSPTYGRKSCMENREVFLLQLSQYPHFSTVNASFIIFGAPAL